MSNLLKDNKDLMKEYNFNKNINIDINAITLGSHKKVWWKCINCGHEWVAEIKTRARKDGKATGCPDCGRKKLSLYHSTPIVGKNDLESQYPEILCEWNYEKNRNLKPSKFLKKSGYKVWWKCSKCGNEYQREIRAKVESGLGCPLCSRKKTGDINAKPIIGKNDLKILYPKLLEEWDYEKNINPPETYLAKSNKKVFWKCKYGHEWEASIVNRVKGRNCPVCKREYKVSFPEKAFLYYIRNYFNDAIDNYKIESSNGKELDIFIPSLNIGIEYDGLLWHKNIKKDLEKDKKCFESNIMLVRIREKGLPIINSTSVIFETIPSKDDFCHLQECIIDLLKYLGVSNIDVDVIRDNDKILDLMHLSRKRNSLLEVMPEITKIWDYEKNGNLTPDMFTKGSEKYIWVFCSECGKSYRSKVKDIFNKKHFTKCINCSYLRLIKGKNDFKTLYPELEKEYDYQKNEVKLEDLNLGERKSKFYWKCSKCGYQWKASIESRIRSNNCPKCASFVGAKTRTMNLIKKNGSLASNYPELAKEWNQTKNGNLKPEEMTCKNKKIVWWKCLKCGYEWQNSVALRTKGFGRCPNCKN